MKSRRLLGGGVALQLFLSAEFCRALVYFSYFYCSKNMVYMSLEDFHLFLWSMSGVAAVVFVSLYFVKAGYGIFRTSSWGFSISNKWAWMLMESPVFIVMCILWARSGVGFAFPQFLFFLLFQLHYFQRSFVFPFLIRGKSRMPVAIMAMGMVFNVLNGLMQGGGLFWFGGKASAETGAEYLLTPHALAGLILFVTGMIVNLHSDHVIRHLRQSGDTGHYLPQKGMYRYVTSANYFGELVEWTGFAVLTASPAAWVFVWWTAANLVPRADAIYRQYRKEFGDEAVGKRKRIIPWIY